ncbi:YegP family protein [Afifella pfennigii]|uniref:YegP family protein n=1 Tax=Afifella pfennigii TaxID=209897 RepID=UPI000556546B
MPHKFKIVSRAKEQFGVQFVYNREVIVWSESYANKAGAKNCIASLKKNAPKAPVIDLTKEETGKGYRFEIAPSKDGQTFVRFVASNGETMVRSETYKAKASAKKAIASVQKNAPAAETVDEAA